MKACDRDGSYDMRKGEEKRGKMRWQRERREARIDERDEMRTEKI